MSKPFEVFKVLRNGLSNKPAWTFFTRLLFFAALYLLFFFLNSCFMLYNCDHLSVRELCVCITVSQPWELMALLTPEHTTVCSNTFPCRASIFTPIYTRALADTPTINSSYIPANDSQTVCVCTFPWSRCALKSIDPFRAVGLVFDLCLRSF